MVSNTGDPDIDAYIAGKVTPEHAVIAKTGDPDIDAYIAQESVPTTTAKRSPSLVDRYVGSAEGLLHLATGGVGALTGGLAYGGGLIDAALGKGTLADAKKSQEDAQAALTYEPRTELGKKDAAEFSDWASYLGPRWQKQAGEIGYKVAGPVGGAVGETAANIPQFLLPKLAGKAADVAFNRGPALSATGAPVKGSGTAAEPNRSMGAAEADVDLSGTSPELQEAYAKAKAEGSQINADALERQARAERLPQPDGVTPLRLRKGQATQDPQQHGDEFNLRQDPDTESVLMNSVNEQNAKLGSGLSEIHRRATPDVIQNSTADHGQATVDAIKAADNVAVTDIRSKYKALSDANGGAMPLDTASVADNARAQFAKKYASKVAADSPEVSEIMEHLDSGRPFTFEDFEAARTSLAAVQRQGGSQAVAAGILRNQLEALPMPPEAAGLKGLADTARSAAKARFDRIEQNPAYKAAVEDNVPKDEKGLHVVGAESPLADSFINRYFTGNGPNASRAYVARMQEGMRSDPNFAKAIEGATLNKLRDAAGLDGTYQGNFASERYAQARNGIDQKADVLLSKESAEATRELVDIARDVKRDPAGSGRNKSDTATTLQRFGAPRPAPEAPVTYGGVLANAAKGEVASRIPGGQLIKAFGETAKTNKAIQQATADAAALRAAKLRFAQDATAPGAGIVK